MHTRIKNILFEIWAVEGTTKDQPGPVNEAFLLEQASGKFSASNQGIAWSCLDTETLPLSHEA